MIQPQELEVWFLLPTIRKELACSLKGLGLKQKDVALKMGLTESAVSQYIKDKRANKIKLSLKLKKEIKLSASKIVENKSTVIKEINNACNSAKKEKILCKLHKSNGFDIEGCTICLK